MLILTRRRHESIIINDNIIITVLKMNPGGKQIRIGITAPTGVSIHREEIYQRILREKKINKSELMNDHLNKLLLMGDMEGE